MLQPVSVKEIMDIYPTLQLVSEVTVLYILECRSVLLISEVVTNAIFVLTYSYFIYRYRFEYLQFVNSFILLELFHLQVNAEFGRVTGQADMVEKMTKTFAEWQPKILGLGQKRKIARILFGEAEDIISGEPDRKSGMYMYNYMPFIKRL